MSNLAYPLVALVASVVGSLIVWYRSRKPKSFESGIAEFHRGMQALAPDGGPSAPNRRRFRHRMP